MLPGRVGVEHAARAATLVVLDAERHAARANLAAAGGLGAGQLGDEGGPLAAGLAALHAKADLVAGVAAVAGHRVDRHVVDTVVGVAHALRAERHDPVVVVAPVLRDVASPADAHLALGLAVEGLDLFVVERPVGHGGAVDLAVGRARLELVRQSARAHGRPVERGAAEALAGPGRGRRVVAGDGRGAGTGARVLPSETVVHRPLVVDDVVHLEARPCLQHDHVDAPPCQLVGDGPAAGARADNDDDAVVVQVVGDGGDIVVVVVRRVHRSSSASSSEIQSMSSKPRSM